MKLVFLTLLMVSLVISGCVVSQNSTVVRIGFQNTPASALVQIADEKGLFEKNGVHVKLEEFTAGKFALQAMLAGSVEMSTPAEIPVMLAKMQGNELYVLSEIGENQNEAPMIVRADGNPTIQDFFSQKRKLSTSLGGTPEYATYQYLKHFNISRENVEIIAQKPEEMVGALSSSSVDAIVIFEPYPSLAEQTLTGTTRYELPPGVYTTAYLLAANKTWVDQNPEQAKSILKALKEAEDFARENPVVAKEIVARRTKFSPELINKIWSDFDLRARISDQLIQTWNEEARWAIDTNKVTSTVIPNFTTLLRPDLQQV
ncbi:MAG: NrtA/SsuA/CpmA family ABC transporter substrate-binding protein [Candidatus Iainarchaeum archaeon]|uniref:NrtA/SsuA/CpmA family ABC transporter substrate-binding protein n=1 Tax=Candidatus Iainarchaeum sp. TaxID=3101447 RepID=A0A7T9I245_9ARCH|nr:MAG: NrtA/SsuA/CpmA family ABC transporter substrate-binding protein [Candidatus Diapherotrites archaeon]